MSGTPGFVESLSARWLLWAVMGVCAGLPAAFLLWLIAMHPGALVELPGDPFRLRLLGLTALYSLGAGVIALLLALPGAVVIGLGGRRQAAVAAGVYGMLLLLPSLTYAYGWSQFLRMFDLTPAWTSPADVFRCVWTLACWLCGVPAVAVGLALRGTDADVLQQSLLDGAPGRIIAGLLLRPAAASVLVVAILASQEYAVFEPTGISVIATEVRMVFDTGAFSSSGNPIASGVGSAGDPLRPDQAARSAAAVYAATPMILLCVLAAGLALRLLGRIEWHGPSAARSHAVAPGVAWQAAMVCSLAIVIGVPMVSLVMSLKSTPSLSASLVAFWPQLSGSLLIALMVAAASAAVGMLAAVSRPRGVVLLAVAGFLVGGGLLAIAQIRIYNRPWLDAVYNGPIIVVLTHVARFGWIALLAAYAAWSGPVSALRAAAMADGAGPWRAAWHIAIPLCWPVLGGAALAVATLSLTEVPAAVLIAPQRPPMFTPMLMTWVHMIRYDDMIIGSLLLTGAAVVGAGGAVFMAYVGSILFRAAPGSLRGPAGKARIAAPLVLAALLLIGGCKPSTQPDEIWLDTGSGAGQVVYPRAIAYSAADDTFFVVDRMARVQQLDRDGNAIGGWQMPKWEKGKPVGLTVSPDGLLYVPDTHYHRVVVYRPDGTVVREWGSYGKGPGQFIYVTDVALADDGRVFVSEYGDNDRVQVFDREGNYLYEFGALGFGDGEFSRPQSIVIVDGLLYVTDACNHRIAVFTLDGQWVRNLGGTGSAPGEYRFPYGLESDAQGNLIVTEFGNNRVQRIDRQTGAALGVWGEGGRAPGQLAYPWASAVDRRGRVVIVDSGNNRLQVVRF